MPLKGEAAPEMTPSRLLNALSDSTLLCKKELTFVSLHSETEHFIRLLRRENNPPSVHFFRHRFPHKSSLRAWYELVSQEGKTHEKRKQQKEK